MSFLSTLREILFKNKLIETPLSHFIELYRQDSTLILKVIGVTGTVYAVVWQAYLIISNGGAFYNFSWSQVVPDSTIILSAFALIFLLINLIVGFLNFLQRKAHTCFGAILILFLVLASFFLIYRGWTTFYVHNWYINAFFGILIALMIYIFASLYFKKLSDFKIHGAISSILFSILSFTIVLFLQILVYSQDIGKNYVYIKNDDPSQDCMDYHNFHLNYMNDRWAFIEKLGEERIIIPTSRIMRIGNRNDNYPYIDICPLLKNKKA